MTDGQDDGGLEVLRMGRLSYAEAHQAMTRRLSERIAGRVGDALMLCEHDPVYTLGRRRDAAANVLDAGDVPVVQVERGGDVTWHGPGQVVGYPIVALPPHRQDLHAFMHGLEQIAIYTLAGWGVAAGRDARNTGVWVDGRKICAIGIACRRWVTWHGLALNVNPDLSAYARINPCGMDSALVTRLADHVVPCPSRDEVEGALAECFVSWWQGYKAGGTG